MKFVAHKILFSSLILLFASCGQTELKSIWKSESINLKDWRKYQTIIGDEEVSITAFNDSNHLYLYLTTFDRARVRQLMNTGFTIWFDEDGEKVGIKYPIRKKRDRSDQRLIMNERELDKMWDMFQEFIVHQNEFVVVNEDDFPLNAYPINSPTGVKLNLDYQTGQLVYSLRIPLADFTQSDFILNSSAGETIGLEFQTGEIDIPGKGFGNRQPGGRRGNGQLPNRSDNFSRPEPIDFSLNLILAKN